MKINFLSEGLTNFLTKGNLSLFCTKGLLSEFHFIMLGSEGTLISFMENYIQPVKTDVQGVSQVAVQPSSGWSLLNLVGIF